MNDEQWYEAWRRRASQEPAPAHFTERVMTALAAENAAAAEVAQRQRSAFGVLMLELLRSRLSRIGICSLAAAACVFRLLHVFALFVAP
jgi:negative regulator of sigma E activity